MLSDGTIIELVEAGGIVIDPWDPTRVQPASVDLCLGDSFRVFHNHHLTSIDLRNPPSDLTEEVVLEDDQTFVIHPGEFCLGSTLEWVELPSDLVARIEGKALALDTPVPTPAGWRTIEQIDAGDFVFTPDGWPVEVVAATEPLTGRDCRRVTFSDGTSVVCDRCHLWEVWTGHDRRCGPRIATAAYMEQHLRCGSGSNLRLAATEPVRYPPKTLFSDPYLLGAWIGERTAATQPETAPVDPPIPSEPVPARGAVRASGAGPFRAGGIGRRRDPSGDRDLRHRSPASGVSALGPLGKEQIPRDYMEASAEQRQALLEGLMDAGGHMDDSGRCELATVHRGLALQYIELIASLGHAPVLSTRTATLNGGKCGLAYELRFTPCAPVFRLAGKLARQKLARRSPRPRTIVAIEPVDPVPVKCVEIAHPRGTFLITRAFLPTHNSSLGRLGLIVHATAGFCDPGWKGKLTLELNNLMRVPIELKPGLPIAQLSFMTLDRPAQRPYGSPGLGSHYQGQRSATESRYLKRHRGGSS